MTYTWFILGNGRKGYLERTVASWEANLTKPPRYRYIFDDSGNKEYVLWLKKKYGNRFSIVPISDGVAGQAAAINKIFKTLAGLDTEYFLGIEEDWMLFRSLDVSTITKALSENPYILQMRIPRTVWHSEYHRLDLDSGSLLQYHIEDKRNQICTLNDNGWYEIRSTFYFWSHNPSVFNKTILLNQYPQTKRHEYDFGINLLNKHKNGVTGFWATNPYDAYITHIGYRDKELLDSLPNHGAGYAK